MSGPPTRTIEERGDPFAEPDAIERDRDSLRDEQDEAERSTKLDPESPRDEVVVSAHPRTLRLVAIAESEMLVKTEMPVARASITSARANPALPTTKPSRRKRMMPRMVSTLGVNAPPKVPNPALRRTSRRQMLIVHKRGEDSKY